MRGSQSEYNAILDRAKARQRGLSRGECMEILMSRGFQDGQANNGVFVYLYHGGNLPRGLQGTAPEYEEILDAFGAEGKENKECVAHLEQMDYSHGQAKSAVYRYRKTRGLIKQ